MSFNPITQKTDYDENLSLLPEQYKDSENLKGMIGASHLQANDIELALFEIEAGLVLADAVGVQLDVFGIIYNEKRSGDLDDAYRTRIEKKATTKYSGEPEAIISVLKNIFGASAVTITPEYPGKFRFQADGISIGSSEIERFACAGVQPLSVGFLKFENGNFILYEDGSKIAYIKP